MNTITCDSCGTVLKPNHDFLSTEGPTLGHTSYDLCSDCLKRLVATIKTQELLEDGSFIEASRMDIHSREGTKVRFDGRGGSFEDQRHAEKVLEVGRVYTVLFVEIYSSVSYVHLKENTELRFNTVLFSRVTPD